MQLLSSGPSSHVGVGVRARDQIREAIPSSEPPSETSLCPSPARLVGRRAERRARLPTEPRGATRRRSASDSEHGEHGDEARLARSEHGGKLSLVVGPRNSRAGVLVPVLVLVSLLVLVLVPGPVLVSLLVLVPLRVPFRLVPSRGVRELPA